VYGGLVLRIRCLEEAGLLQVLIVVSKCPGIYISEVIEKIDGTPKTVIKAVNRLEELGLIRTVKERKRKGEAIRRYLYPLEKGKKIGELLARIEEILSE